MILSSYSGQMEGTWPPALPFYVWKKANLYLVKNPPQILYYFMSFFTPFLRVLFVLLLSKKAQHGTKRTKIAQTSREASRSSSRYPKPLDSAANAVSNKGKRLYRSYSFHARLWYENRYSQHY